MVSPSKSCQMKNEREPGFYWVKYLDENWSVACWNGNEWWIIGLEWARHDNGMTAIDERKIINPNL